MTLFCVVGSWHAQPMACRTKPLCVCVIHAGTSPLIYIHTCLHIARCLPPGIHMYTRERHLPGLDVNACAGMLLVSVLLGGVCGVCECVRVAVCEQVVATPLGGQDLGCRVWGFRDGNPQTLLQPSSCIAPLATNIILRMYDCAAVWPARRVAGSSGAAPQGLCVAHM